MMIFLISFNLFSCNVQTAYANPLLLLGGAELGQIAIATIITGAVVTTGSTLDAEDWDYISNSTAETWHNLSSSTQDAIVNAYKDGKKISGDALNSVLNSFNSLKDTITGNWNINAPISYPSSSNTFQGVGVGRTVTIGGDVFTIEEIGTPDFLGSKYVIKINGVLAQNQTKYRFTSTTDNINSQASPFFVFSNDEYCGVNYLDLRVVKSEWGRYSNTVGFTHIDSQMGLTKPKVLTKTANLKKVSQQIFSEKVWEDEKEYAIPPSTFLEQLQNKEQDLSFIKVDAETKDIVVADAVEIPDGIADGKTDWSWWSWLKNWCTSFFTNLFSGLGNLLKNLFIPDAKFMGMQLDTLNSALQQKLDYKSYIALVDGWKNIINPQFKGIKINNYMFWRGDTYIVSPTFINNSLDFIHRIIKGFLFPLLVLYNYSQAYRLVRGTSYINTDNGRDKKEGGGKK